MFFDASDFQLYLYLNQNCSKMKESIGIDHKMVIDIHCKLFYMLDAAATKCFLNETKKQTFETAMCETGI